MGKDRYLEFLINSRTSVLSSQTRNRSFPVRQNPGEGKRGRGGGEDSGISVTAGCE